MKLTKSALRSSQQRLAQLERYLPTLQLKKSLLQQEVFKARAYSAAKAEVYEDLKKQLAENRHLFVRARGVDFAEEMRIQSVQKGEENIAGIDLPTLQGVTFELAHYHLLTTMLWTDSLVHLLQKAKSARIALDIAHEREAILSKELREVSIRVNLFEKIMIPRTKEQIKQIRVFLSDQELMAVARAKAAKKKVQMT